MFLNNPHCQSSGIIIFVCKYYIVISSILVVFFLDVVFFLFDVILLELYEKPRMNKNWDKEKSATKDLCERHHFFECTSSLLCHFLLLSSSTPLPKWRTYWMAPVKIHNSVMGGILGDIKSIKISCNLILAGSYLYGRYIILYFF